jgi:hypothetical protein
MSFDESQNPPVFSNFKVVLNVSTNLIAWPSFLPDALGIAYHHGGSFTTERDTAELRLLDTSSSQVNTLAALNGYLPDGSFYLPYGMAEDGQVDYEPSALPIAIGGYYWLMFSSRRAYGNLIAPGGTVANGGTRFAKGGPRKKFWMSAIDIDYPNKSDPSHPAFYMEGQELEAGNLRPFVALEPCLPEGATCESGSDCCAGFCRETSRDSNGIPVLQCVPRPQSSCSNIDEVCITVADCCDPSLLCINSRCAIPTPIIK